MYEMSYILAMTIRKRYFVSSNKDVYAYAMSLLSSTDNSRFTACADSSASTSMTCFAIDACLGDANGISTLLINLYQPPAGNEHTTVTPLHSMPIGAHVHGFLNFVKTVSMGDMDRR